MILHKQPPKLISVLPFKRYSRYSLQSARSLILYTLYHYPRNASWAIHLMLKELAVDYELALVDRKSEAQKSADYLRLNPTGRIPTLIHTQGDSQEVLFESGAIALYLCEQHPQSMLLAAQGTPERAQCYQWLFYLTATVQAELMIYFYPQRHNQDTSHPETMVQAQEQRLSAMFAILDGQIGDRDYVVGNQLTLCDCFLFMICDWAKNIAKPPMAFPNLARCLRNLAKRESFRQVCELEKTDLGLYQ